MRVLELAESFDLVVGNMFLEKNAKKLITHKSENCVTVVDNVIVP